MKVINQYKTELQMVWKIDAMKLDLLDGCNSKQLQKMYVLVLIIFVSTGYIAKSTGLLDPDIFGNVSPNNS